MSEWRRADQGDLPERGQIITLVKFSSDPRVTNVKVYERMRVEVILEKPTVKVLGPTLPFVDSLPIDLPERPDNPSGPTMLLWRERS